MYKFNRNMIYNGNEYQNIKGKKASELYSFFILNQKDYKKYILNVMAHAMI